MCRNGVSQGPPGTAWPFERRDQLGQAWPSYEQLGQAGTSHEQLGQPRASLAKQPPPPRARARRLLSALCSARCCCCCWRAEDFFVSVATGPGGQARRASTNRPLATWPSGNRPRATWPTIAKRCSRVLGHFLLVPGGPCRRCCHILRPRLPVSARP